MAIQHTALLCPSLSEFVAEITTEDALRRADFKKIRERKHLTKAEHNLLLAVEKLYSIHSSNAWIVSRDFEGILFLLWHGVAEVCDLENFAKGAYFSGDGPLQEEEQRHQSAVTRPMIQSACEEMWERAKEVKKLKDRERKLLKKVAV
jgi:hypothetical protein